MPGHNGRQSVEKRPCSRCAVCFQRGSSSTLGLRDGRPQPNSEELLGMAKRLIQVHAETMIINKQINNQ